MSEENELLRQQLEDKMMECDDEGAARETAEAASKEATGTRSDQAMQQPRAHGQQMPEQGHRSQTGASLILSQNNMLVPQLEREESSLEVK